MISINNLTVSFGSWELFSRINFHISESDKIGLVGKNGAGKSTLMKIICGEMRPTSGSVDKPQHLTVGYLPQLMEHHKGRSVMEETMTAFDESNAAEREVEEITLALADRTDYESKEYTALIERLNELNDKISVFHSEPPQVQAERTLRGLGFLPSELDRPTETFSQGWNMRIELAKILLQHPDLLLLDEPTNHLDIESIEWLEGYLKDYKGAVMLVSHDRKFLDNVTRRTVELMLGNIYDYKVPYTQYTQLRAERIAQQTAAYENQQRMIEKTEDFIRAFRYKPTKSNQVQSRIKALEKLERIEIDETDNATLTVKFPPAPRAGDVVYKCSDLTVGYPGKVVFRDAAIEIKRGEKVAFVGRNGEGKTTMMRVIVGELEPISGESRPGHNVDCGYFAQNQEDVLDKKETVFSTLDRIAVGDIRTKLRDILAQFLFRGEDIDKRVSVLSGGERARLGMAKLMLQSHNLLALDEPTNHMDIKSKDILKQALKAYDGTLVIVSHDRDFLDGLVDKLYEFRDGHVREFLGGVSDFLAKRRLESLQDLERWGSSPSLRPSGKPDPSQAGAWAPPVTASGGYVSSRDSAPTSEKRSYEELRAKSKEDKKRRNRVDFLEKEIEKLEKRMKEIEGVLSAPKEGDDIMELTREYLECKRDLDAKTDEWGELID
ncbi:MAG: ABC-F family ATP-binding cassette domain-containing protein [Bacteroidales bacterium]|nr:ABC-F family ATP-binding cassette domain-containing protein [Bacteroidales bacterium]